MELEVVLELPIAESLGLFYEQLIWYIGYWRFEEYKVMSLASYGDPAPYRAVQQRVAELLAIRTELPPLRPWFNAEDSPAYLPDLLGRNGLDIDGRPLSAGAWGVDGPGPSTLARQPGPCPRQGSSSYVLVQRERS